MCCFIFTIYNRTKEESEKENVFTVKQDTQYTHKQELYIQCMPHSLEYFQSCVQRLTSVWYTFAYNLRPYAIIQSVTDAVKNL